MLKRIEALAAAYRYTRYRKSSKIGKRIDRLVKAVRELRQLLDHEFAYVKGQNEGDPSWFKYHGSDAYYGQTVRDMQIATACMDFAECVPSEPPGITPDEFVPVVENLLAAAQEQPPGLPWRAGQRPPLQLPWGTIQPQQPPSARYAGLRAALLEDPDQPQAAFVKRFRVHPITVKRCRRELEEAGAIPFLAHRHGPAQTACRCAELAEAAD
jgi:hypothetical protein